jgi:hypothetical protein
MADSGRVNEIGPLTLDEQGVIAVRDLMEKYSFPGGPVLVRPRNADSSPGPRLFAFTRAAFIRMCADMASSPLLQFRDIQENKMIVVARIVADLNEQQNQVISERATLEGVLLGFKNQDPDGMIIGRVQGIADALAINADHNEAYDLVEPDRRAAFRALANMQRDVFAAVERPQAGHLNVTYDGKSYATSVEHFVWFFLRFLLADADTTDLGIRERRRQLGADLLDYLSGQLQRRVLESVRVVLAEPAAAAATAKTGILLGDFFARGPGLEALKNAPGLSQLESARGPDYRALTVEAKHVRDLPKLREWLEREISKNSPNQIR